MNNLSNEEHVFFTKLKKYFTDADESIVLEYYKKMLTVENMKTSLSLLSMAFYYAAQKTDLGKLNYDLFEQYFWNLQKLSFEKMFSQFYECKKYGLNELVNENLDFLDCFDKNFQLIQDLKIKNLVRNYIESTIKEKFENSFFNGYELKFINLKIKKILATKDIFATLEIIQEK